MVLYHLVRHTGVAATRSAIPVIALCIVVFAVGCQPTSDRRVLQKQTAHRLREELERRHAVATRFERLGTGTTSAEVLKQFGKPTMTVPCRDSETCWYYDIARQKYFVCLDRKRVVTCRGERLSFGSHEPM
jgi:hypothetical protein